MQSMTVIKETLHVHHHVHIFHTNLILLIKWHANRCFYNVTAAKLVCKIKFWCTKLHLHKSANSGIFITICKKAFVVLRRVVTDINADPGTAPLGGSGRSPPFFQKSKYFYHPFYNFLKQGMKSKENKVFI